MQEKNIQRLKKARWWALAFLVVVALSLPLTRTLFNFSLYLAASAPFLVIMVILLATTPPEEIEHKNKISRPH